jgi:hypothetical protein
MLRLFGAVSGAGITLINDFVVIVRVSHMGSMLLGVGRL